VTLIVIEGLDRTGKTTLAATIRDAFGPVTRVAHHSAPEHDDPIIEYVEPYRTYRPGTGKHIVIDRHYLGEAVWPKAFDRPTTMTEAHRLVIETQLRAWGAVLVLAKRDPTEVRRFQESGEEPRYDVGWAAEAFKLEHERAKVARTTYEHGEGPGRIIELATMVESAANEEYQE
jgi:hypothetical protein